MIQTLNSSIDVLEIARDDSRVLKLSTFGLDVFLQRRRFSPFNPANSFSTVAKVAFRNSSQEIAHVVTRQDGDKARSLSFARINGE